MPHPPLHQENIFNRQLPGFIIKHFLAHFNAIVFEGGYNFFIAILIAVCQVAHRKGVARRIVQGEIKRGLCIRQRRLFIALKQLYNRLLAVGL